MPDISLYFQWFTNGQGTYFYSNGPSILAFDLEKIQLIIMEHATLTVGEGFPHSKLLTWADLNQVTPSPKVHPSKRISQSPATN